MGARLYLPRREHIQQTHETDSLKFYYQFGMRTILRKRLEMVVQLLGERPYDQLLGVNFGGGIFLKELSRRCRNLHGIDVHENFHLGEAMLANGS